MVHAFDITVETIYNTDIERNIMEKRTLLAAFIGLVAMPFVGGSTKSEAGRSGSATFVVPANVDKIRVRSYVENNKVLDRVLDVQPGQVFRIDPA